MVSEDDVRRIVREEIRKALEYLSATASGYDPYFELAPVARARDALAEVAGMVRDRLQHAEDCDRYLTDEEFALKRPARDTEFGRYACSCGGGAVRS